MEMIFFSYQTFILSMKLSSSEETRRSIIIIIIKKKLSGVNCEKKNKTILASFQTNISADSSRLIDRWTSQLFPPKVQKETLREAPPHFPTTPSRRRPFPVHGSGAGRADGWMAALIIQGPSWGVNGWQADGQVRAADVFSSRVTVCFLDVEEEKAGGQFAGSGAH